MPTDLAASRPADLEHPRPCLDDVATEFTLLRPRLLAIAARIVGDRTEADDIVQEAWVRWQNCDRSLVASSTAFLVTTTTRLAINVAQSARARRESYVGQWLHDPADRTDDPALGVERREDLELGLRVLVQRLTPNERVAYVLRHAFDRSYQRIAELLQISEANARQLVSRAGRHLASEAELVAGRSDEERRMHASVAAARAEEVAALERLFAVESR